jgi:hypothetical protein
VIEALTRVLTPDFTRTRQANELDFHARDTRKRSEVEVVLGDLGDELEQTFFDHLELWDIRKKDVVDELEDPDLVDRDQYEIVVRLCYRASWNAEEATADHWVDYPKSSDPESGLIDRVSRNERESLQFSVMNPRARPLDLAPTGLFRKLVEGMDGADFPRAIEDIEKTTAELSQAFSGTTQMSAALRRILEPLREFLKLSAVEPSKIVTFLPEGGSISGMLRSLSPALDLQDGIGTLPLYRHGSTLSAILRAGQALAAVSGRGIVVMDDFGEDLDAAMSEHLASVFRGSVSQVWLSTRRSSVAEAFQPDEVIRLARKWNKRQVFHGRIPTTKYERLAARHRSLQLLPALASRAVIIVEGPHDRAALNALALRLFEEQQIPLPAAGGVSIIDAGAADGCGGSTAIPRLAKAAREMGLRTVAIIDFDKNGEQTVAELRENLSSADVVIRLPRGHAIELALVSEIQDHVLRGTLKDLESGFGAILPETLEELAGPTLEKEALKAVKRSPGLHAQFIGALPKGILPPVAVTLLKTACDAASTNNTAGHIQL